MGVTTTHEHDTSIPRLVGDLLGDIRTLLRQEMALARAELREELSRLFLAAGVAVAALGTLAVAAVWFLVAATRAVAFAFHWPLAGAYAGVGFVLGIAGLVMLVMVSHRFRHLQVLPKTRETLREQVQRATHNASEAA
jgi:hypothetical protein